MAVSVPGAVQDTPDGRALEGADAALSAMLDQVIGTFVERVDVFEVAEGLRAPAVERADDIDRLAAELGGGWASPFEFVSRAVRFLPYSGAVRGPAETRALGQGNSLDQAQLLRALLRVRGVETRLAHGRLGTAVADELLEQTVAPGEIPGGLQARWAEIAADHWWVEALRDGRWIALDPSIPNPTRGSAATDAIATFADPPPEVVANVVVEVRAIGTRLAASSYAATEVTGRTISLDVEGLDAELGQGAIDHGPAPEPGSPLAGRVASRSDSDPALLIPRIPAGWSDPEPDAPVTLLLRAGGRTERIGPIERGLLGDVTVEVTVRAPASPVRRVAMSFGDGPRNRLVVAVAGAGVPEARIGTSARTLHGALTSLANLEIAAYDAAWAALRESRGIGDPRNAPSTAPEASITRGTDEEAERHVAVLLHEEALAAWDAFRRAGPEAIAWATLAAIDGGAGTADGRRLVPDGVRLLAVAWRSPTAAAAGELLLRLDDAVVVPGLDTERVRGLRTARGLIQSAVLSQVLHRIADRVPRTAFDFTLRSYGAGGDLRWWRDGSSVPAVWPRRAREQIVAALSSGFVVVASPEPIDEEFAWWQLEPSGGDTIGWVAGVLGPVQASISLGSAFDPEEIDAVLGSLPDLHRATRWLIRAAAVDSGALAEVPPAACAAAGIVAELIRDAIPADWAAAAVDGYCGS